MLLEGWGLRDSSLGIRKRRKHIFCWNMMLDHNVEAALPCRYGDSKGCFSLFVLLGVSSSTLTPAVGQSAVLTHGGSVLFFITRRSRGEGLSCHFAVRRVFLFHLKSVNKAAC